MQKNNNNNTIVCNWCGNITELIWVHGHGQCKICRTNIEECCKGETCDINNQNHSQTLMSQKRFEPYN